MELLEQSGADPTARDDTLGCTPRPSEICVLANWGFTFLLRARLAEDPTLVNIMDGRTSPLHEAARNNNVEVARLLLDLGANPSLANADGKTPLDVAVEKGNTVVAEALRGGRTSGELIAPRWKPYSRDASARALYAVLDSIADLIASSVACDSLQFAGRRSSGRVSPSRHRWNRSGRIPFVCGGRLRGKTRHNPIVRHSPRDSEAVGHKLRDDPFHGGNLDVAFGTGVTAAFDVALIRDAGSPPRGSIHKINLPHAGGIARFCARSRLNSQTSSSGASIRTTCRERKYEVSDRPIISLENQRKCFVEVLEPLPCRRGLFCGLPFEAGGFLGTTGLPPAPLLLP